MSQTSDGATPPDGQEGSGASEAPQAEAKKKSDLVPRVITAVIGIPALLAILFLAPSWAWMIVIALAMVISAWEYTTITLGSERRPAQVAAALGALAVGGSMYWTGSTAAGPNGLAVCGAMLLGVFVVFFASLFTYKDLDKVTLEIGSGAMCMLYCGAMPATMALLHRDAGDQGGVWVALAMALVWGSDAGAYFVGRAIGKHKLAPRVSPKKSIEGAVGGLVSSVLIVIGFNLGLDLGLSWGIVALLAIPANVLGQLGDLCESLLKRAHGVKDSGTIIYGHGGLLDRIDAVLFAVPWVYGVYRIFVLGAS